MNIGEEIKKQRQGKGMTQQQLADQIGTTYQNISQYERGVRTPKMAALRKIAEALGVDVWEIIGFNEVEIDGPSSPLSRDEQDLVDVYRAVDDHGRKIIRTVADLEFERWRDELAKDDQKRK